jgi:hypothetical protein
MSIVGDKTKSNMRRHVLTLIGQIANKADANARWLRVFRCPYQLRNRDSDERGGRTWPDGFGIILISAQTWAPKNGTVVSTSTYHHSTNY